MFVGFSADARFSADSRLMFHGFPYISLGVRFSVDNGFFIFVGFSVDSMDVLCIFVGF